MEAISSSQKAEEKEKWSFEETDPPHGYPQLFYPYELVLRLFGNYQHC